jgi:cytochrome P450
MVAWSVYSMHRRKDIYGEDADEYKPERWETLRLGWEYLPFNGGPRICIGQQFALTEVGYTIVRLVQEFKKIESVDPREWLEGYHLTLSSGNGVQVSMDRRS